MCAPAAIGLAQAGVGIMGAMGQSQAQQAQYAATKQQMEMQRRQAIANRNHSDAQDIDRWLGEQQVWQAKKSNYKEQNYNARDAASDAYGVASMQEEKLFRDFVAQSSNITLQQLAAKTGGLGQRGGTADRMASMNERTAGEALATLQDNHKYGMENIDYQKDQIGKQWAANNRQNWKQVSIAPSPTMRSSGSTFLPGDPAKPGNMGLMAGIGQSILGGISTYNSLKPPGEGLFGGGGGAATPNFSQLQIPTFSQPSTFNPGTLFGQV